MFKTMWEKGHMQAYFSLRHDCVRYVQSCIFPYVWKVQIKGVQQPVIWRPPWFELQSTQLHMPHHQISKYIAHKSKYQEQWQHIRFSSLVKQAKYHNKSWKASDSRINKGHDKWTYWMGNVLKSVNYAMCVVVAWIYTPFVTNVWMRSKLHKYLKRHITPWMSTADDDDLIMFLMQCASSRIYV